jgi:hypothetical protein
VKPLILAALLLASGARTVWASDYTAQDVEAWASDYAYWYETAAYPHDALLRDVLRVARCESANFDSRVINNVRRGKLGEIGVGQWMPGGIWSITPQAQAGYPVTDVEANVAGLVWAIAAGMGPRHWSCW